MCFWRSWYKITTFQKVIKYLALAFAVYLIFIIFTCIISVGRGITGVFDKTERKSHTTELKNSNSYLDVNLAASNLKIKNGNEFKVKTNSDTIAITEKDNKIIVKETKKHWNFSKKAPNVTITIPSNTKFDDVYIETGAGKLDIEEIKAKNLKLKLGAGKINIDNIESDNSNIETGAGSLTINNGILNNAIIDGGVGKINITAQITGNSKIETGIGSINVNLLSNQNDYKIEFEKGLGSIEYNGKDIKNSETTVGNGSNFIKVEGGIGSIVVNTQR